MKKSIPLVLACLLLMLIGVPSGLVVLFGKKEQSSQQEATELSVLNNGPHIRMYLKGKKQMVTLPLEQYVKGVVAAEMPVTFSEEALKAQAVAARTNMVRRLAKGLKTPEGADITDDVSSFQAYSSDEQLKTRWGVVTYEINMQKIARAVAETKGQIMTYRGEPIDAAFFSTSNGYTEASENYWGKAIPYLRSVSVPWDKTAPHASDTKSMPLQEFYRSLGMQTLPASANQAPPVHVLEATPSERIKRIQVGDKTLSGREFREALGLNSTDFSWQLKNGQILFTTHGYGHGVGMSQYGADGMAREGHTYKEILAYFYKSVTIEDGHPFFAKK